jgi:two-component system, chemotaxis family, response regulator Rcp1
MGSGALSAPSDLLLVEDNPGDVRLITEALRINKLPINLHVVRNGVDAMLFLRREGQYVDPPRPDLIVLDLNLPRKDGREVLAEIKADPDLQRIPVIILTSSQAEEDILKVYSLNGNCYVTKPMEFDHFMRVVKAIEVFWLTIVKLPSDDKR